MQKKIAGTVISERGTHLAPLSSSLDLKPRHGCQYIAKDVLSLPKPVHIPQAPAAPAISVLSGDLHAIEELSRGPQLTIIDHAHHGRHNTSKPAKRRPKNAIRGNKSSFISRGYVNDQISRRMKPEDLSECLVLTDFERSLQLMDFGQRGNKIDFLLKLVFTKEWPLCHAYNVFTAGAHQLDIIVGMSSGDLVWIDLVSQRYERINKHHPVPFPVLALAWVPNSENLVAAVHSDGRLVIYDVTSDEPDRATFPVGGFARDLVFLSPTQLMLTFTSDYAKILDLELGSITEYIPALFGSIFSVAVSPDFKYWACGGESDIVSIYEIRTRKLVVNLIGHKAWIRSIAWDKQILKDSDAETEEDSENNTIYRLVSLGDDQQVIVWDFALSLMTPPRNVVLQKPEDLQYVSETHTVHNSPGLPTVHAQQLRVETAKLLPVVASKPLIPEYGPLALTSLRLTADSLIVAAKGGRYITYQKHGNTYHN